MEYSIEDEPWTDNVVVNIPVVRNGKFTPSESAGWGVSINPDWLKKAEYNVTNNGG
jgi:L-alanine-DL-glutamate epimerase-like enolase superfamily enzyme